MEKEVAFIQFKVFKKEVGFSHPDKKLKLIRSLAV
jgi:hypothetical protein